jgi:uncharacterized protein
MTVLEPRYFVARLLGPRPTFPMDITDEEKQLMQLHVEYWTRHMAEGRVVVIGPVLDPKGVWGLAVLRATDEAEVHALEQGDPVVAANRGFSYETLPMLNALLPG